MAAEMLAKEMVCVFVLLFSILPWTLIEFPELVKEAAPLLKTSEKLNQSVMLLVTLPLPAVSKYRVPVVFAHQSVAFQVDALFDQFLFGEELFHVCLACETPTAIVKKTATLATKVRSRWRGEKWMAESEGFRAGKALLAVGMLRLGWTSSCMG